jgi:hypothetical protein
MTDRRGARAELARRRRRPDPRRLRLARLGGQDPRLPGRARAASRTSASASACTSRSRSSRATSRARRRQLDRDGPETPYPGDRPAARAEGGRGSRRHDAPRRAGGRAARGTRRARCTATSGDRRAPPPPLRGQQRLPPAAARGGLVVSGTFQEGRLVEIVELPDHPWFVASQFHPEFKSRPTRPAPLFREFVGLRSSGRARASTVERVASPSGAAGRPRSLPRARRGAEPAGEERAVADRVIATCATAGSRSTRTTPGRSIGSTMGNIYVCARAPTAPGRADLPLRAPRHGAADGADRAGRRRRRRANAAGTILGADNKAAVAAMLEAVRRVVAENRRTPGSSCLFTARRRSACGAPRSTTRAAARIGYVYDQAAPIGGLILGRPRRSTLEVTFTAARRTPACIPEEGRSRSPPRPRDRRDAPRPDRRGDDRERRHDHGRHRAQHRPRVVHARAEARSHDEASCRVQAMQTRSRSPRRRRVRGRDARDARATRLPLRARRPAVALAGRRSRAAATSPSLRLSAAAPTRTSSTSAASRA